jgi:hypothetical protein
VFLIFNLLPIRYAFDIMTDCIFLNDFGEFDHSYGGLLSMEDLMCCDKCDTLECDGDCMCKKCESSECEGDCKCKWCSHAFCNGDCCCRKCYKDECKHTCICPNCEFVNCRGGSKCNKTVVEANSSYYYKLAVADDLPGDYYWNLRHISDEEPPEDFSDDEVFATASSKFKRF